MQKKTSSDYIQLALKAVRRERKEYDRKLQEHKSQLEQLAQSKDSETRRIAKKYLEFYAR